MKTSMIQLTLSIFTLIFVTSCEVSKKEVDDDPTTEDLIIDHNCTRLSTIPIEWINKAKTDLHIAYAHTSHGGQITYGMTALEEWKGAPYQWNDGISEGQLDIDNYFVAGDLGAPDRTTWESRTRGYLPDNEDVNVVMWSWCGEVTTASEADINTYLTLMQGLEDDYPNIKFVYMTGHLDGTGLNGNLHIRNEQIRTFCKTNNKILYDFADIESYDPDGVYYHDKKANDGCYYDSNGNGYIDGSDENWAINWQNSHTEGVDWFDCTAEHSQPINGNMKAYAAWWLWARLAGWDGK